MEERFTYGDTYARPMFDRGFTGHEHLQAFGLINMNGRMYDPVMSSFLSADRYMQDPTTAQGFNRYAYCMYNPLRFTDPTGWVAGVGGGHHPNGPLKQVLVDGQPSFELPEVTITPYEDEPILKEDFWDATSSWGGGGGNRGALWDLGDDNPSIGPDLNNSGGGSRSGKINQSKPDNIDIISKVITTANLYTSTQSALYYDPLTKTWTDKLGIRRSFDFNGNQYTGGKNSFGKLMSKRFNNAGRILGSLGVLMSINQCVNESSIDGRIEYGFDAFIGFAGVIAPEFFALPSTIWFLGGKQVTYWYANTTIIPMIENGIKPGLMENQPFK